MTGGSLPDGTYVLSEGRGSPNPVPNVHIKFRISDGGSRIQHIEGLVGGADRTAAGVVSGSDTYLVRGFICPGTTTLIDRYTVTPTGLQIVNSNGPMMIFTRQ